MDELLPLVLLGGLGSAVFVSVIIVVLVLVLTQKGSTPNPVDLKSSSGPVSGGFKTTGITFYGQGGPNSKKDDNGVGFSGIDLFEYTNMTFEGKPVFAGAVHQNHAAEYMYSVLEVQCDAFKSPNKSVLIHVVDICNRNDSSCDNVNTYGFLVDVHWTAFSYVGLDDGLLEGSYRVVGKIPPSALPTRVWMKDVQNKKDSIMCSCTGSCTKDTQKWTLLGKCNI